MKAFCEHGRPWIRCGRCEEGFRSWFGQRATMADYTIEYPPNEPYWCFIEPINVEDYGRAALEARTSPPFLYRMRVEALGL